MALPTIDVNSTGGIKTLQDLYTMLAGSSETTSGGTKTTTESISQEGMNAMLQSALANTAGLAAVSSGQRAAGGYGSSVNTMLTNDLLTRTASQIAQANKTTTTSSTPVTTVKGGVTGEGATKAVSFVAGLQGLQELDKLTGASKKIKDYFGTGTATDIVGAPSVAQAATAYSQGSPSIGVYGVDTSSGGSDASTADSGINLDFGDASAGFDTLMADAVDTSNTVDYSGGMTDELMWPEAFADGGEVSTKNKPNVLGTSQFNTVADPRAGKIGGASGENAAQVATTDVGSNTSTTSTSTSSGGSTAGAGGDSLGNFVNALATKDGQTFAKIVGGLGKLTGSPVLQQAGLLGNIVTSDKPVETAAVTAGNIATKGALGQVLSLYKAVKQPGVATAIDAAATLNPITASINGILNLFGFGSVGKMVGESPAGIEADQALGVRTHMTAEQQAAAKEWAAQQGQQVSDNPDVISMPVTGPGTIETTDLAPVNEGGGSSGSYNGWSNSGDQGNGVTTSPVSQGSVTTTNLAQGGEVSGPGTGTSDSIPARLSDGETVITAATTAKVKELFGDDFFHNLEKEFNAPAAARQIAKGRA